VDSTDDRKDVNKTMVSGSKAGREGGRHVPYTARMTERMLMRQWSVVVREGGG